LSDKDKVLLGLQVEPKADNARAEDKP
jgi:hypothetical protein